jgi:aspartyl-tRNA(Asn)/glutamyl-tRNA(Gln) amidotransferase subunit C
MSARKSVKIDRTTVAHLATLSNISLSDDELAALASDIEKIIGHIEQLGELDTSGVEPTYQVTGLQNVMRDDVVLPQIPREELLSLAPERTAESVKVPRVL